MITCEAVVTNAAWELRGAEEEEGVGYCVRRNCADAVAPHPARPRQGTDLPYGFQSMMAHGLRHFFYHRSPHTLTSGRCGLPGAQGLRVRVGLHSGVAPHEMEKGMAADGRWVYTGIPMALAKAVGDAADGGMVVMTQACFQRLARTKQLADVLVLCMGMYQLNGDSVEPTCVYQVRAYLEGSCREVRED
eukprot:365985-Chlamydomonas_euryale.AAC.3